LKLIFIYICTEKIVITKIFITNATKKICEAIKVVSFLYAFQVKLLSKQGTCMPRKTKQANQPFETTFRLQVK